MKKRFFVVLDAEDFEGDKGDMAMWWPTAPRKRGHLKEQASDR